MTVKTLVREIAVLALFALVMAFAVNALSPRGIALLGQWDVKKGVISARAKGDAVDASREIELPEAKALFDRGVLFVDARDPGQYAQGRIKRAVSLSVREFWEKIGDFEKEHPQETPLVVYCSGRECPDSHELAQDLLQTGYQDVKVFVDGFPLWESEGLPVEP